jgi:hypothetical protein
MGKRHVNQENIHQQKGGKSKIYRLLYKKQLEFTSLP